MKSMVVYVLARKDLFQVQKSCLDWFQFLTLASNLMEKIHTHTERDRERQRERDRDRDREREKFKRKQENSLLHSKKM